MTPREAVKAYLEEQHWTRGSSDKRTVADWMLGSENVYSRRICVVSENGGRGTFYDFSIILEKNHLEIFRDHVRGGSTYEYCDPDVFKAIDDPFSYVYEKH